MPSWVVTEDVLSSVAVRRAMVDDLPRVVELLQQLSMDGAQREDPGPPLPQRYLDMFAVIDADPNNDVLVALLQGEVVGTFQLTIVPSMRRGGIRSAMVEAVVVDERVRGQRVGEAMMRWAIDEARRRGCDMVHLTSNKSRTDAHRFYERLGFRKTHEGMRLVLEE
ncbi:MAG: GNAT family N-acetyltransferase [Dehalococcoidia bacterium]